jgi:hypothetical protein
VVAAAESWDDVADHSCPAVAGRRENRAAPREGSPAGGGTWGREDRRRAYGPNDVAAVACPAAQKAGTA